MIETALKMCALFPEQKLKEYVRVVSFENFYDSMKMTDVIKANGISPEYLCKSQLKIHPHDILIQDPDLAKTEDQAIKDLLAPFPTLWKLDLIVLAGEILFPLTQAFNSRFDILPCAWLSEYFRTCCDKGVFEQDRVSLENFCSIQQVPNRDCLILIKELIRKYIFAVSEIKAESIESIYEINNPFYVE